MPKIHIFGIFIAINEPRIYTIHPEKRQGLLTHENNKRRGAYSKQYGIQV